MRQSDGSEILGPNDPRSIVIGIIHVTPGDDRQSVLTAITTQEKLGRDQIILELPAQNKAFKSALDFEGLRQMTIDLEAGLVLIVPPRSKIAGFASKQGFKLFNSLDDLVKAEFPPLEPDGTETVPPATPVVDVDEEDHTMAFPVALPPYAPNPFAGVPITPQAEPESEEETTAIFEKPPAPYAPTSFAGVPITPQAEPESEEETTAIPEKPPAPYAPTSFAGVPITPQVEPEGEEETTVIPEKPPTPLPPLPQAVPIENMPEDDDDEPLTDPSLAAVRTPPQIVDQMDAQQDTDQTDYSQQPGSYLPTIISRRGNALVPSNALPPVYYEPIEPSRRRRSWRGLIITGIILLILIGMGFLFNRPILDLIFPPSATVTILPDSQQFQRTYQITAVLSVPDPAKNQVDARALYASSPTQTQTVKATGQGHTPGQQSQGVLTFYNFSTNPQTIQAGTVIFDSNGLAVVNDDTITLPGSDPSTGFVSATDSAHSISPGNNQNIAANDFHITPCCGGTVYVTNTQAFTGGQDAQTYTYVQQSDIDSVTQSLEAMQLPQATMTLRSQVRSNEKPEGTPKCAPLVQTDHQAGDQTSTFKISVSTICTGEVYDAQAVQALASRNFSQDVSQGLGPSYTPVGPLLTSVTQATSDAHGDILLTVNALGVWVYQFTNTQRTQLARLIAGKSSQDARQLLLKQPGVRDVMITLTGAGVTTVPTNTSHITINVSAVQGLHI
jgi:VCBS repeat-containing protein